MEYSLTPPVELSLKYSRKVDQGAIRALLLLDQQLSAAIGQGREPIFIQMRLSWWRDALCQVPGARPRSNPVLSLLEQTVETIFPITRLVPLVDAWEAFALAEDSGTRNASMQQRGSWLFGEMARVAGKHPDDIAEWGGAWSLWDMAQGNEDFGYELWRECQAKCAKLISSKAPWPRELRTLAIFRAWMLSDVKAGQLRRLNRPGVLARIVKTGLLGG